jgi:DNA (cytosine-5)-methyltransferase 1
MKKFLWFSHFSGGGGSTLGAIQAGFIPLLGIEWDKKVAELYEKNLGKVICQDIGEVSILSVIKHIPLKEVRMKNNEILIIQTSPPCQEYSQLKLNKNPNSESAKVIWKTRKFYALFRPEYVILENVRAYAKSEVYIKFKNYLKDLGYEISFEEIVNCADYGVPQTRQRLITIFNYKNFPAVRIKPTHKKEGWVGWYSAIEDLIPDLREVELTGKQLEAISLRDRRSRVLVDSDNSSNYKTREGDEPIFTITKGFSNAKVVVERVGARSGVNKIREENSPIWTLKASLGSDGKGANREKLIDVSLNGVVKSLNVVCLARLQTFPPSYEFSGKNALDVHVIGNSVPPLLIKVICEEIKNTFNTFGD